MDASGCLNRRACRIWPQQVRSCITLLLIWLFWEGGGRRMETWLNGSLKLSINHFLIPAHVHSSRPAKSLPNRMQKPNQLFCTHLPLPQCFLPMHLPHPPNQTVVLSRLVASQCLGAISIFVTLLPPSKIGSVTQTPTSPLRGWVPCLTSCNSPENKHRNYAAIGNHHFMRWTPLPAFFHRVTCVTVGLGYVWSSSAVQNGITPDLQPHCWEFNLHQSC